MNWGSASDFFAMGGYGLYVWGSYIVCAIAMVAEPLLIAQRHRHLGPPIGIDQPFQIGCR